MANEKRLRALAVGGLVEDNPLSNVATTLTSAGLAALPAVGATEHMALVLDPDGKFGAPEVVWVTAHTAAATTATISRGAESTTARQHDRDVPWIHGPTLWDFERPKVKVRRSANVALTAAGWKLIDWDAEDDHTHVPHDNATNPSRLTVPRAGWWRISAATGADGNVLTGSLLKKNGSAGATGLNNVLPAVATGNAGLATYGQGTAFSELFWCIVGDYFTLDVYASAAANLIAATSSFSAELSSLGDY
jgi:hypothetical protein